MFSLQIEFENNDSKNVGEIEKKSIADW